MTHIKNLELAPNGIYHLRSQRNGINHRISLKTRNLSEAGLAVAIMRTTLSCMKIVTNKIKDWSLEIDGQNIKITTEDNAEDCAQPSEKVERIGC